jgi:lipopolysaccharide export system protein LptA
MGFTPNAADNWRGTQEMSALATWHWRELAAGMAIVVACAICAPDATAQNNQGPPNALQGFSQNRGEPVKIRAVSLDVREKDKTATFTGDVYVLQGDTEMRCKVLVVSYEAETDTRTADAAASGPGGDRQVRQIDAKGDVVVVQKDENATGDAATFNMRENTVTLSLPGYRKWMGAESTAYFNRRHEPLLIRATLLRKAPQPRKDNGPQVGQGSLAVEAAARMANTQVSFCIIVSP